MPAALGCVRIGPDGVGDLVLGDEHEGGGVAERDERVAGGDPADRSGETTFDEPGDDGLADATLVAGLVDDEHPADLAGVTQQLADGQWAEPAQVDDPAVRRPRRGRAARRPATTGTARCPT